jgi:hypothetical protein
MKTTTLMILLPLATLNGCKDKAEPDYARCVQLGTENRIVEAWSACNDAIGESPTSTSGKAAAAKLEAMRPKYEAFKKDEEERARQAMEERARVQKITQAAREKVLRTKITLKRWDTEPDSTCTGKGLPPYRWSYEGGTYAEDAELAGIDGCRKPFTSPEDVSFCCPTRPFVLPF